MTNYKYELIEHFQWIIVKKVRIFRTPPSLKKKWKLDIQKWYRKSIWYN